MAWRSVALVAAVALAAPLPVNLAAYAAPSCSAGSQPVAAKPVAAPLWPQRWLDPQRLHAIATGTGIRVAVLDSGVDATHPQLTAAVEPGWDVVANQAGGALD